MQQLLSIETVPISIKYVGSSLTSSVGEIRGKTPPKSNGNEGSRETGKVGSDPKALAPVIPLPLSRPSGVRKDSYVQTPPQSAFNLTYTAKAQYSDSGEFNINMKIDPGVNNSVIFRQFGRNIQEVMSHVFERNDSSFDFNDIEFNMDIGPIENTAPGSGEAGLRFSPPSFEIEILEMPKVIIKYVGGPIYIPRSADPNYEAPPWEE